MVAASTILLVLFSLLAAIDGVYIHLVRLRLPSRPRSWREHLWHTFSALLFPPIVIALFLTPSAGPVLWTALALNALLYGVEALDVQEETASRADLGGLSRFELGLHVVLIAARTLAVLLALASRPLAAWSPFAPPAIGEHPAWVVEVVSNLLPGSLVVAGVHVYLAWRHRPKERAVLFG